MPRTVFASDIRDLIKKSKRLKRRSARIIARLDELLEQSARLCGTSEKVSSPFPRESETLDCLPADTPVVNNRDDHDEYVRPPKDWTEVSILERLRES